MKTRPDDDGKCARVALLLLALLVPSACDGNSAGGGDAHVLHDTSPPTADGGSTVDAALDATLGDGPVSDTALGDTTATDGNSAACQAEIAALSKELSAAGKACTAAVRLDHDTRAILGYQVICGAYQGVSESQARATAAADTGYGAAGQALHPANPDDEYVFYESPGDFGGAAAVSADTGLTVFGGSIVWNGAGDITYPKSWRAAAELGSGCPAAGGIIQRAGYDLVGGQPLPQQHIDAAVGVVLQTAVPAAMWKGGYVFDAVVLRYPRTVGGFAPETAEWIVLVNGGWLE